MQLLIAVGTTQFDQLIKKVDSQQFYQIAVKNGFSKVILQKGNGKYKPIGSKIIQVQVIEVSQRFSQILEQSDLIICHAGAGTLIECLIKHKNIITVINQSLQQNHQQQLWDEVSRLPGVKGVKLKDLFEQWSQYKVKYEQNHVQCKGSNILTIAWNSLFLQDQ